MRILKWRSGFADMTFQITPSNAPPIGGLPFDYPTVQVMNFVADPALYSVTRGTGENSNVITIQKLAGSGATP